jgi:hypothetical protein
MSAPQILQIDGNGVVTFFFKMILQRLPENAHSQYANHGRFSRQLVPDNNLIDRFAQTEDGTV